MALECKYVDSMTVGQHVMIVGEIVNVAAEETCLGEKDVIDIAKVDPMIYDAAANKYNRVGEVVDKAFFAGVELLKK